MRYEFLIGMRYLRARRRERFVSLIAAISLAGVALGTFALTVTLAVMSGFQEDLRERLLAFNPHITLEKTGGGGWDSIALGRRIAAIPGVAAVAPFVSSQVMAVSQGSGGVPGYVSGGVLRGIDPTQNAALGEAQARPDHGRACGADEPGIRYRSPSTASSGPSRCPARSSANRSRLIWDSRSATR